MVKKNKLYLPILSILLCAVMLTSCSGEISGGSQTEGSKIEVSSGAKASGNTDGTSESEGSGIYSGTETRSENAVSSQAPVNESKSLKLICMGDNIFHLPVVDSGLQEDGSLKYHHLYENFMTDIEEADISVINQETMLGGSDFPYSGYPLFNSPQEVGDTLAEVGFDVVLHATNHTMDKGYQGFLNTINFWDKHLDTVKVLGINKTPEDQEKITVIEKNGIKVALLNYTQYLNGLTMPEDKPYIVNMMDQAVMERHIQMAKEISDFIVVFPHWGTEYIYQPDSYQTSMAKFFADQGVDAVIGMHPHVLETVEWVEGKDGNKTLVYYSLGNFVSCQDKIPRMLGGMAEVVFEMNGTEKSIKEAYIVPVVTHYEGGGGMPWNYGVYKLSEYTDELAAKHGVKRHDNQLTLEALNDLAYSVVGDWIPDN